MKKREVILLTAGFPFGKGETFLEAEIPFLSEGFDKVIIIPLSSVKAEHRKIPLNCLIQPLPTQLSFFQKFLALRFLFAKEVHKELNIIRSVYKKKLNKGIVTTLLVSYARAKCIAKKLERFIDPIKEQVFYSYWCEDSAIALALLKQKHPSLKTVTRMHGWDVYFEVSSFGYLPYRHFIADKMNNLFPISKKGKLYIQEKWKVNLMNKTLVARLGVSSQQFTFANSKTFSIVSCSNVIPLKRVELILAAIKNINQPLKWVHFGDGPLLQQIKKEAKGLNVEFKGRVQNKKVLEYYKANTPSLFINVSTSEGIPVSIMEAFSFGSPVIATDVGGNNEIVDDENGTLVPATITPEELGQEILRYIEMNEEELLMKRKAAYATWEEKYNADKNYTSFVRFLAELAEGRRER